MGPKGSAPEGDGYGSFVNAFETLQAVVPPRGARGSLWPLWELFKDVSSEANADIDRWVEPLITRALDAKKKRGGKPSGSEEGSFLDHMVDATDDPHMIRDEVRE